MHSEYAEISPEAIQILKKAKQDKRRVIAVGTTSCRTLESWAKAGLPDTFGAWTDIFIYPGYKFGVVNALITNFHLPKSSLLLLVSALAGKNNIDKAYFEAISQKYRFFSYGDAMFIV
jgi:S-adenosylmethionine:tRNA ribosyltransferase-isomerase